MLIGKIANGSAPLKGHISNTVSLRANLTAGDAILKARIVPGEAVLKARIAPGTFAPLYSGAYSVDPNFEGQTLPTKDRLMEENVTVEPIYTSQVENFAGGYTFYIGGEFYAEHNV